jgi:hypothetical protein
MASTMLGELGDDAVACAAEDVTAMDCDQLFHYSAIHAQSGGVGFFVPLCKAAIPLYISSKNCRKPKLHGKILPARDAKWRTRAYSI